MPALYGNDGPKSSSPSQATSAMKVVLLGDSGVGKTSIAVRFVHDAFHHFQESTIGASFLSRSVRIEDQDATILFRLWDTAGQERYQSLTPMYFRGAHAALLVFDMTKLHSFETLQRWVRDLRQFGPENIQITVCGNKLDLAKENRSVSMEQVREFAESIGAAYDEVSAKDGTNVEPLFEGVARRALEQGLVDPQSKTSGLDLTSSDNSNCC